MELFKNFQIGGLFQAGRRMAPPWGAFRRFTNAYKDPKNTLKAYGRGLEVSNAPSILATNGANGFTHLGPLSSQYFRRGILQFHAMKSGGGTQRGVFSYLSADNVLSPIMQPYKVAVDKNCVVTTKHMTYMPSSNFVTCSVARKAYMNAMINTSEFINTKPVNGFTPEEHYLMAFDGLRMRGAGLPTPWTHLNQGLGNGAHYARVVYVTIGQDGEAIYSPYMEQRLEDSTPDRYISGYSVYPGTKRADVVGGSAIFPNKRAPNDHLYEETYDGYGNFGAAGSNARYFDKRYIEWSSTTVFSIDVNGVVTATNIQSKSPGLDVGDWIMSYYPVKENHNISRLFNGTTMMLKIASIVGSTVTFEVGFKYLDEDSVTWIDASMKTLSDEYIAKSAASWTFFLSFWRLIHFSNIYMVTSYSTTQGSGYRVSIIEPLIWEADGVTTVYNQDLTGYVDFTVPWLGVISSFMADWYDANAVKATFPPLKGITNYKELLVGFDANAIYFNDITLGGSTEMVSGLSNLIPYGSEYGDLVAICGSEDFLFVGRERRCFVITGDIAGSSFNVTECDAPVGGPHNAKCVTNAWSGQVIFANSSGIYSVNSSGGIKDISDEIKGLFFGDNVDGNLFDKSVFKTIATTRATGFDGGIFKFFLEDIRGFVNFLTAKASNLYAITGSNLLVLNSRESKWYEFDTAGASSAEAKEGNIVALETNRAVEDGVMRGTEKQLLVSQRMTVDQPSLEKAFLQLKWFGDIIPKTSDAVRGVTIGQINNWEDFDESDHSNWNTEVVYSPAAHEIYNHKKRFDSSKPQTTSIILESLETGSFEVEGMEIEGVVAQQGMKK